jgi:hypothetical protein
MKVISPSMLGVVPRRAADLAVRLAVGAGTVVGGVVHAQLFLRGYWYIPTVGPAFAIQAAGSLALAALLLVGGPGWLRLGAALLALATLGGFVLSRTVGVAGFTEHGWQPAPQTWIGLVAETGVVVVVAGWLLAQWARASTHRRAETVPMPRR